MTTGSISGSAATDPPSKGLGRVFLIAYLCQGFAQHFCLLAQPLNNFLKAGLHLDAVQVSLAVSFLMAPWVIKPIYGMLSDARGFAAAGPRRRRFLVIIHSVAAAAYIVLAASLSFFKDPPSWLLFPVIALVALAGIFIAFATVVLVGMTVDRGEHHESTRLYFGQQALAYSSANIAAVFIGGRLCAQLPPSMALVAALSLSGLMLLISALMLNRFLHMPELEEVDSQTSGEAAARISEPIWGRFFALVKNRPFLVTLLFLTLWNLSPSLGVSLYFYECDKLKFTQGQIGILSSCTSIGTLLGAIVFRYFLAGILRGGKSTYWVVAIGVASNLSYVLLTTPSSGVFIELFRGLITFITTLAIYGLAADVSPRGMTATAMAIQIAVFNIASEGSIALGGFLYGRVFGGQLLPLIVVSSLTTLLTAFLIPYLVANGCKQVPPSGT